MKADTSTSASEYCRHGIERWWARCDKCADEAVAALLEKTQALAQARRDVEAAEKAVIEWGLALADDLKYGSESTAQVSRQHVKGLANAVLAARARQAELDSRTK